MSKMNKIRQAVRYTLFFAIFFLNLTAYANSASSSSIAVVPSILREQSLIFCTHSSDLVDEQIYDKLIEFDPIENKFMPALASHFEVSEDGLSVTLFLRPNVAFHQTKWFTPTRFLNADDVVFSLNRMLDEPALKQSNLDTKIVSMTALADDVINIQLAEPNASLLTYLASQYGSILSKEYALQLEAGNNLRQLDLLPVGTGAYQLSFDGEYQQNDYVRLTPHLGYWGEKSNVANVIVDFSTTSTGRMAKFLNGECDIVAFPEPSQLLISPFLSKQYSSNPLRARLAKEGYMVESQGANIAFLAFNMRRSKMQDRALRQQIAQSIDRERLAKVLFYGLAEPAYTMLPKLFWEKGQTVVGEQVIDNVAQPNGVSTSVIRKNLQETDRLSDLPANSLLLWVVDENQAHHLHSLKMAELIRADLARSGLNLKVRKVSRAYFIQQLQQGQADYDLILSSWLADNADLDRFLTPLLSCQAQHSVTNLANWCDPKLDLLLDAVGLSEESEVRQLLYQQIQKRLIETLPILPLVNVKQALLVRNNVKQVRLTPFGQVNLSHIRVE